MPVISKYLAHVDLAQGARCRRQWRRGNAAIVLVRCQGPGIESATTGLGTLKVDIYIGSALISSFGHDPVRRVVSKTSEEVKRMVGRSRIDEATRASVQREEAMPDAARASASRRAAASTMARSRGAAKHNSFGVFDRREGGWYVQMPAPEFKASDAPVPDLNLNGALALLHGIKAPYASEAIINNALRSQYARNGPESRLYTRDSDRNGGGALGVYTRAVGVKGAAKWKATGMGVGSGDGALQLVIKPDILEDPNHIWRASGTDNMGMPPGANKRDGLNSREKWQLQSNAARNRTFNDTISGDIVANNEQLHWAKLPLDGLKAIIRRRNDVVPRELEAAARDRGVPILPAAVTDSLMKVLLDNDLIDKDGRWLT